MEVEKMAKELTKYQKYYRKHKEYYAKKGREYHIKNRDRILAWKAEYRKRNRAKLIADKQKRRDTLKKYWLENPVNGAPKKAEEIILSKVLPQMGYIEIFKPMANFYFDALVKKKSGRLYAIEVTTAPRRVLGKHRAEICKFLKIPLHIFFVKPDLSCYYLIKMNYPNYILNPEYYHGKKTIINKTNTELPL